MPRVCIIGLDCLMPELVFDGLSLPTFSRLARDGVAGPMQSCVPAITVPAWSVMTTGVDPGVLGVYGFRNRAKQDYASRRLASSLDVREPTLWALASRAGLFSRVLSVPQTHPPKPLNGILVSDRPTAGGATTFTHPPELSVELEGFVHDVEAHRDVPEDELVARVRTLTAARFRLARDFVRRRDWQLFMMVEMGPDRLQHALLTPGSVSPRLAEYYRMLDAEVAELCLLLAPDDVVLVVSDHGAQPMRGAIALNDWLCARGLLTLAKTPSSPTPLDEAQVDWSKTRAFADGGYVGRIYLNIAGREPLGVVTEREVAPLLAEIEAALLAIPGADGEPLRTRVHRPRNIYAEVRSIAPELIVEFDDLAYRAIGSVGNASIAVRRNDTGRDLANHARHGVFIMQDGRGARPPPPELSLFDVAPTVLDRLGVPIPKALRGRVIG